MFLLVFPDIPHYIKHLCTINIPISGSTLFITHDRCLDAVVMGAVENQWHSVDMGFFVLLCSFKNGLTYLHASKLLIMLCTHAKHCGNLLVMKLL